MARLTRQISPGRAAAGLAAVFVAAAAVFWFSHVPRERAGTLAEWQRDLGLRADFRRHAIDEFLKERLADARLLASFPAVQSLATGPARGPDAHARAHFDDVVAEFRAAYGYELVAVFDAGGLPKGFSPAPAGDPGCVAAARAVLASGVAAPSLHAHGASGAALTIAAPIRVRSGALLGAVVTLSAPGAQLYPLLGEALSPRTGEAVLLAKDGDRAVYLSPLRYRSDAPLTVRRPLDEEGFVGRVAFEKPATEGVFTDYRGERVVAATRRLAAAPWALVLKVDETEALEPYWSHVESVALGWGASLVAALALLWGVSQRVRRVRAASDAANEARFRTLFEQASDAVFVIGADGRIQDANHAAEEMHGVTRGTLVGMDVTDLRPHEQRRSAHAAFVASERVDRLVFVAEHVRADGRRFPVEIATRRVELPEGPVHVSIVRDIDARKRAEDRIRDLNRLLRTIVEINQLMAKTDSRDALLGGACRILVEEGGFALVWVGLADFRTGRVVPVARAGRDEGYVDEIEVRCDDSPLGRGPVGTAIRTGCRATVAAVADDPSVMPWRTRQLEHGFRSVVAFPLQHAGAVVGALAVYSSSPDPLGEEEASLLDELAAGLAFALEAIEALGGAPNADDTRRP